MHIKAELLSFGMSSQEVDPFSMHGLMKALKYGIYSITCRIIGTLSKSIYDFIKSGMVWKSFVCNFILQWPNDASMSSYVWPTIKKYTKLSLKMFFVTINY